ncbi:MAG: hypothetical protein GYB37_13380 [Algicola sp.]|nr:hypothetical protein [Algicola sp.]
MKYLLIGGAQSVGKSESIYRLAQNLIKQNYEIVAGSIPDKFKDFKAIVQGTNQKRIKVTILLNTATDEERLIQELKSFLQQHNYCDIIISSIRDDDFYPRKSFFKIMELNPDNPDILEVPLAKITRRGDNFNTALKWYNKHVDYLLNHILKNKPFEI